MRNLILTGICLSTMISCSTINQTRKGAGISRQQLFLTEKADKTMTQQTTLFWSHYDATQRGGIYMVTDSGKVVVISEPPPDAGVNSMLDIIAKTNVKEVEAGAKVSAVKSIAELGKRNAANYVVRDIAFRIETMLNNNNGKLPSEAIDLYKTLLATAKDISVEESKTEIIKSKAEMLKELNSLIEKSKDTTYKKLNLDSTFYKNIQKGLE